MPRFSRVIVLPLTASLVIGLATAHVRAQFAPPPAATDNPSSAPDQNSAPAAAPAAPSLVSPAASLPATARPENSTASKSGRGNSEPLLTLHANQTLTTNALLGMVNGEPVFVQDLLNPIDAQLKDLADHSASLADFTRDARALIKNQWDGQDGLEMEILVSQAAEASLSEDDKKRVALYVADQKELILQKYAMSEAAAQRDLQARGSSLEKELQHHKRAAEQQLFFIQTLRPKISVTYPMVRDYYDNNIKKYQEPDQLTLYRITIPITRWLKEPTTDGTTGDVMKNPSPDQIHEAETHAMDEANELVKQLNDNKKDRDKMFIDFAGKYSDDAYANDGGKVPGKVTRETYNNPELVSYIFSLPPDTIGQPLMLRDKDFNKTQVIIARVKDKTVARTIPLVEKQDEIKAQLNLQQLNLLEAKEYVRLLHQATIDGVDRNLELAVDAAVSRYATK